MAPDDSREQLRAFLDPVWGTDFFQTVKLIELMMRRERAERDLGERTNTPGAADEPEAEPLEFKTNVSLRFAPTDLYAVDLEPDLPSLTVEFMTLAGVRGPMPLHYAQLIRERNRKGDRALHSFFDLISHRLVSLLWRIRQKFRIGLHAGEVDDHDLTKYLTAFTGLLGPKIQALFNDYSDDYDPEGDDLYLFASDLTYYAGLLWQHDRSMQGLERILEHHFGFPVHGRGCQGEWIELEDDARSALTTRLGHNKLGVSAIAGRRVWNPQAAFAIDIGPVDWQTFLDLLPIGRRYDAVHRLVNFYSRGAFNFSFNIAVAADQIHAERPGLSTQPSGPRLGWTSWVTTDDLSGPPSVVKVSGKVHTMGEQPLHELLKAIDKVLGEDLPADVVQGLSTLDAKSMDQLAQTIAELSEEDARVAVEKAIRAHRLLERIRDRLGNEAAFELTARMSALSAAELGTWLAKTENMSTEALRAAIAEIAGPFNGP